MNGSATPAGGDRGRAIGLAAYAALHAFIGWTLFAWFMWKVVPAQMAIFEGGRIPVPAITRAVETFSHWFIRLLPFAVILALFGLPVVGGAAAGLLGGRVVSGRSLRRWATGFLLVVALAGTAADAFVVWAMNYPLQQAVERWIEQGRPATGPR